MNDELVLQCNNLQRIFVQGNVELRVLDGVDLEVRRGENIAIVGASGSGKSTLLHCLGGLDRPSQGEVRLDDVAFSHMGEAEKGRLRNQKLGFVYQFHHLLPEFSALENTAMPLLIRGTAKDIANRQASEMLGKVGLAERLEHRPAELSGGERQRAAIARAMVTRPQCIMADEPTGNLDRHTANAVLEQFVSLNRESGTSLIIVTHDMALAGQMDRVLSLLDGRLVQQ